MRDHIFRGVEFSSDNALLPVATITNVHSGKCLDVANWDLQDHAALQQYTAHGGDNQRWALRAADGGRYQLMVMHSGKCLDVAGWSTADHAPVQQYERHGGTNQKWRLDFAVSC